MPPELQAFDHVHVYVTDRRTAEAWYRETLGMYRTPELEFWAEGGGPLTIQNPSGSIHIALFERVAQPCRSVVALRVAGKEFNDWRSHLGTTLPGQVAEEDHVASVSLYFSDPDGNPYEITTYEITALKVPASSDA